MTSQACWPASWQISMIKRDVQLTACYKNNPTGTGRCNNIHTAHSAHQTANWCFDSRRSFKHFLLYISPRSGVGHFLADIYLVSISSVVGPGFNLFLRECNFSIGPYVVDKFTAPGVCIIINFLLTLAHRARHLSLATSYSIPV